MGFFDALKHGITSIGKKTFHAIHSLGNKWVHSSIGKIVDKGLDYGIQGLQTVAKGIDDTPILGLGMSFIPGEQAVVSEIDELDLTRKLAKKEITPEEYAKRSAIDQGKTALSIFGAGAEYKAIKGGISAYKGARALSKITGEGVGGAVKTGIKSWGKDLFVQPIKDLGIGIKSMGSKIGSGMGEIASVGGKIARLI